MTNSAPAPGQPDNDHQVEQHVADLMGPAQQIDGTHSYEETPMEVPTSVPKPTVPPPQEVVPPVTPIFEGTPPEPVVTTETTQELVDKPEDEDNESPLTVSSQTPLTEEVAPQMNETPASPTPEDEPVVMKESLWERMKEAYFRWWDNRTKRYITLAVVILVIGIAVGVPVVRNALFNLAGVRTSVSVTAIDQTTLMPLKNVVLQVGTSSTKTGDNGQAKLYGIRLGQQTVSVHKAGFADIKKQITFGMRTVDLGELDMKATGMQYRLTMTDLLSGKKIEGVAVTSGEATAKSDAKGLAVITLPPDDDSDGTLTIQKNGYRTESLKVSDSKAAAKVTLVPAQKEVFVEKADGVYSMFKMDLDGTHRQELLAGTGIETADIGLSVDPAGKRAALVSTRDDKRNQDGYLLQALTITNISTGESDTIEHAEDIALVGWQGTVLVYQQTVAGASAANPTRQKLMSYDYATNKRYQIAAANGFVDVLLSGGKAYYIVSSTDPAVNGGLVRADLDGSDKKTLFDGTLWAFNRIDYKTLRLQLPDKWYSYTLGSSSVGTTETTIPTTARTYLDSPDGKLSAWLDALKNDKSIAIYDIASGKNTTIVTTAPVHHIMRWVGSRVIIYQTANGSTVTDWAVSLDGGEPRELTVTTVSAAR